MIPVTMFAGRTVAVFGLARSGIAAAQALVAGGATVAAWDDGEASRQRAGQQGLSLTDLAAADWSSFAALVLSPGVPLTHPKPHWTVERASAAGIEVIGDTELFFRQLASYRSHNPQRHGRPAAIGITGTNGKSTTTALTAHVLASAGLRVEMGGNIGRGVLDLAPFDAADVYVLELSSYQIDLTPLLTDPRMAGLCDVGMLLNLTPDHLDRHGSMQHYAEVKERLVASSRQAIIGLDDWWCRAIAHRRLATAKPVHGIHIITDLSRPDVAVSSDDIDAFTAAHGMATYADGGGRINGPATFGLSLNDCRTLKGPHNAQNAAAATIAAAVVLGGSTPVVDRQLQSALQSFRGLAHRMELLGELNGIPVINDSKATNAESTAKALASLGSALHWIVGGQPKEGGIEGLAPFFHLLQRAYLIGNEAAVLDAFEATLAAHGVDCRRSGTLKNAIEDINRYTAANAGQNVSGGNILLSPACASFDQFKDFEDRGNQFRKLLEDLPGFVPYASLAQP